MTAEERIEALVAALQRCIDENDYCYGCDMHPSAPTSRHPTGHGDGCPVITEHDA